MSASRILNKRFMKGLEEYGLTLEDIEKSGWKYCGGKSRHHRNYFKLIYGKDAEYPTHSTRCVCGHFIEENCYITNGEEILILGNVCIKKFLNSDKAGRTCEKCDAPHQNSKDNFCNKCRVLLTKKIRKNYSKIKKVL